MRPEDLRVRRLVWNLGRVGARRATGRLSVHRRLSAAASSPRPACATTEVEIISHFPLLPPRPWPPGWRVSYYIDATLRQNFDDYGLADRINPEIREDALRRESEHYHAAERIVCMSRWAANSVVAHYGIPPSKVHVILPGANLGDDDLAPSPDDAAPPLAPLRLGFIGKDWRRKGLPFLLRVAEELERRGVRRAGGGASARARRICRRIRCSKALGFSTSSSIRGASCG